MADNSPQNCVFNTHRKKREKEKERRGGGKKKEKAPIESSAEDVTAFGGAYIS